jgi:histidyl-tRNA synthetase
VDLKPPKGTRDFYPDDMRTRKWLFREFAYVSELFGFEQYDSPVLENESLFIRKAGEEIRDQLFNFQDKGGRSVALRPELTPSLSRMVLAKGAALPLPIKWYNIGQCWRYERMMRGRRREHYQWNMDVIGADGMTAEAELLAAITTLFKV